MGLKFFLVALFLIISGHAFGQVCTTDMLNQNRDYVKTFTSYGDSECSRGAEACRKEILVDELTGFDCVPGTRLNMNDIILSFSSVDGSPWEKSRDIDRAIIASNAISLIPLIQICNGTKTTWADHLFCLKQGIATSEIAYVTEKDAIKGVFEACDHLLFNPCQSLW